MSSWSAEIRRLEAAQRSQDREVKKRQKELDRRLKEQAKLSALEQARLEVESYENALEVLLSIHHEQSASVNWSAFASALSPYEPSKLARHELAAMLQSATAWSSQSTKDVTSGMESARVLDNQEHQEALAAYAKNFAQWERLHSLAQRVLVGEPRAYTEAVSEFSAFSKISNLGSSIHITVHHAKLIECELKVNGRDVIPPNGKSLIATGKVAVKAVPKAHLNELYQDHICSCVLRLAREMLALLPVETVLVTATVEGIDSRTGHAADLPVLSLAAPRAVTERLDYEHLDPSDSLENFQHRGDVMALRKSGEFVPISPLTPADLTVARPEMMDFTLLVARVREFRAELGQLLRPVKMEIAPPAEVVVPTT